MAHPVFSPGGRLAARTRAGLAALAAAGTALWLAGCTDAIPTVLPDLVSIPRNVLSNEEQQKAIEELAAKKETHQAEAIKQIENTKLR
jgi:hypothetical protein